MLRFCLIGLSLVTVAACQTRPSLTPAPERFPSAALPPVVVSDTAAATPGTAARAALAALAALGTWIDSLTSDPMFRNAQWGILIVDPDAGDTLYSHNAGKLFLPASNMKIVTSAVALAQLGPDYRYRTTFAVRHRPVHGVIAGDLVVIGRGDPTVSDHMERDATLPLRAIADSLAAYGVRRITGHIVAGGDAFSDADVGYGWDWDDLAQPYGAGVDELMFNEGFTTVTVHGGDRPGAPVRLTTEPATSYPLLRNHVRTVRPTGDAPPPAVNLTYDSAAGAVVVDGTVAVGDSSAMPIAYRNQAGAYLAALTDAIAARGIHVRPHAAAPAAIDSGPWLDTLFTVLSPPLRDILPPLLKPSQNQIAEALLKTIGLERTGVGTADSGARVVQSTLLGWGAAPDGFVIRDGSGLSRHDYLSPETIVHTLIAIRRDTAFQVFYGALPVAGVDGTIADRMRGTAAAGNVRAKTGYVDRARSLSGYVSTADGVPLVFSFLCNNWTTSVHEVERVQDEIAVRLASLVVGRP
jgi:D-alanyl-D-alanine carboxypeptidase/D-alanyl-D-alanine-endopeptidase (penicillin-binding protein 4)